MLNLHVVMLLVYSKDHNQITQQFLLFVHVFVHQNAAGVHMDKVGMKERDPRNETDDHFRFFLRERLKLDIGLM